MARRKKAERERTNESLRRERARSDRALVTSRAAVEQDADAIVERARETADAVLVAARVEADERLDPSAEAAAAVALDRAVEDEVLRQERDAADEGLRRERAEGAAMLRRILPLERAETDRHLLTERDRSDEALANRDGFLGIVSHDLRNLLSGIVMSAASLAEHATDPDSGHRAMTTADRIQRYAARMNRLIGDLLDVASIDAGQLAMARTLGDARLPALEAVDLFQPLADAKGIVIGTDLERNLPADIDHGRLLQVLSNLVANAIKFSGREARIFVRGERVGSELRFTVSDSGCGIAGSKLEAVFERFWQAGKDDRRGVGLGLFISRSIVEAHGGRIWAESVVGQGSRFTFTLPAAGPAEAARAPAQHHHLSS